MTPQGTITVERMDGSAAAQAVDAFRLVYADVFAEPPYNEAADDVTAHLPALSLPDPQTHFSRRRCPYRG